MQREEIGRSGNNAIGPNPPGTIGDNFSQGAGQKGFNIFNYVVVISYLSSRRFPWHHETSGENDGCKSLFKNTVARGLF